MDRVEELQTENERLRRWVNDLQSGMFVNCVYCGHRYGAAEKVQATMADELKLHIAKCEKHPMALLLRACKGAYHALASLLEQPGISDELLRNVRNQCGEAILAATGEDPFGMEHYRQATRAGGEGAADATNDADETLPDDDALLAAQVPRQLLRSLRRYALHHVATGDFLRAVLSNDLMEAAGRADGFNRLAILPLCQYVWHCLPSPCWGTRAAVDAWIKQAPSSTALEASA